MASKILCRHCILPITVGRGQVIVSGQTRAASSFKPAVVQTPDSRLGSTSAPSTPASPHNDKPKEAGAMTRRLSEATESTLFSGRGGRRAIEEASFDPDLKAALLSKLSTANLDSENAGALSAAVTMPRAAGQGTRSAALEKPWTGDEETADTVLRMLDDAKKPLPLGLRGKASIPIPNTVDIRPSARPNIGPGKRIETARDKAAAYAEMGLNSKEGSHSDKGLNEKEREAMRMEFKERFTPGARAMPTTLSGLADMANQRIEEAMARGQFKNIPRGKDVERDTRADNPFIDTTEYLMNKIIQRQNLVPPWIEKQQELSLEVNIFRTRLRADWKRHAARTISSQGGTIDQQVARAKEYADAEVGVEQVSSSTISVRPLRDPDWERTERSYMELCISKLNDLARSYNLMAPEVAKKAYFNLERELKSCYADVAPDVAKAIRDRVLKTNPSAVGSGSRGRKIGDVDGGEKKVCHDDKGLKYGLARFWEDLWKPPTKKQ